MKSIKMILALLACVFPLQVLSADPAYPEKPIRLIVNDTAGGTATDAAARLIAERLAKALGQPVVVENKSGASGIIAAQYVAAAEADGYTLLFTQSDPIVLNPLTFRKLPYDPQKDFKAIVHTQRRTTTLMVNAGLPVKSLPELIAYAKSRPGALSFASFGTGTQAHIAGEYLNRQAGIRIQHVPYKNAVSWVPDIVAGRIEVAIGPPAQAKALLDGGKVKVLAVSGTKRSPLFPDVPTFIEAGVPDLSLLVSWQTMLAPAKTPDSILQKLNAEVSKIMDAPDMSERVLNIYGGEPVRNDLAAAAKTLAEDRVKWQAIVNVLGNVVQN